MSGPGSPRRRSRLPWNPTTPTVAYSRLHPPSPPGPSSPVWVPLYWLGTLSTRHVHRVPPRPGILLVNAAQAGSYLLQCQGASSRPTPRSTSSCCRPRESESALNAAVPPGNVEQQGPTASGRDSEVSPAAARRPRGRRCGARAVVVRTLSAARARGRFSEPVTFHSDRQPERPTGY